MRRREFVTLLGSTAITWPLATRAQQSLRMRRIGVLVSLAKTDPEGQRWVQALLLGLHELGWQRGVNLEVDIRYGDSNNERIKIIAKELVADKPEVLEVTSTPGAEVEAPLPFDPAQFIANIFQ